MKRILYGMIVFFALVSVASVSGLRSGVIGEDMWTIIEVYPNITQITQNNSYTISGGFTPHAPWLYNDTTDIYFNYSRLIFEFYNSSQVSSLLAAQNECSEISGCVVGAITAAGVPAAETDVAHDTCAEISGCVVGALNAEVDPKIGTLTPGKICTNNGTHINCTLEPVTGDNASWNEAGARVIFQEDIGSDCGANNYSYGVNDDGTLKCRLDIDTNTNCSAEGSCSLITYDSETAGWDKDSSNDITTANIANQNVNGSLYWAGLISVPPAWANQTATDVACSGCVGTTDISGIGACSNICTDATGGSGGGANVSTTTCSGTQKVSAIDNSTGVVTCSADVDTDTFSGNVSLVRYKSEELNFSNLTGYPGACAAGSAITQLADAIVCSAFQTGSELVNTTEQMQDASGALLGGTETGISVTYDDANNDIDFVVSESDPIGSTWPSNYTACGSSSKLYFDGRSLACNADQVGSGGGGANVSSTTCTGTQKVSAIDNSTGVVTCSADVDTDTSNTTEEMQDAYGALVDGTLIYNDTGNTTGVNITWFQNNGVANRSVNWNNMNSTNSTQFLPGWMLSINMTWLYNTVSEWFDTFFGVKTTDDLTQGSTNKYDNESWNETGAVAIFQEDIGVDCGANLFAKGVDDNGALDCAAPPTNTTEEMQDAAGAMATNGDGVDLAYSDASNTLTPSFDCSDVAGAGLGCSGEDLIQNDSSSQASSDNSARTYIQDIILDTYGHITGLSTATETVVDTSNTTEQMQDAAGALLGGTETLMSATYDDANNDIDFVVNNDLHAYSWTNVIDSDITNTLTCSDLQAASSVVADAEVDNDISINSTTGVNSTVAMYTNKICLTGGATNCDVFVNATGIYLNSSRKMVTWNATHLILRNLGA